jgi:hypothetical protein
MLDWPVRHPLVKVLKQSKRTFLVPQVPLTAIPSVLKLRYGKSVPYQKVWQAAVDARLPAEQLTNGRWRADPDDAAKLFEIGEAAAA